MSLTRVLNYRALYISIFIFVIIISLVNNYSRYSLATLLAYLKYLLVISYHKLKRSAFRYFSDIKLFFIIIYLFTLNRR